MIYSYFLPNGSSSVNYSEPCWTGRPPRLFTLVIDGNSISFPGTSPLSIICKQLRHEFLIYFWTYRQLIIKDVHRFMDFVERHAEDAKEIRTLTLDLFTLPRDQDSRIKTITLLPQTSIT